MEIATPPHDHIPRGGVVRLLELADEIEDWLREVTASNHDGRPH